MVVRCPRQIMRTDQNLNLSSHMCDSLQVEEHVVREFRQVSPAQCRCNAFFVFSYTT